MLNNRLLRVLIVVTTGLLSSGDAANDTVEQIGLIVSNGGSVELPCRKLGAKKPIIGVWKKSRGQSSVRVTFNRWIIPRYRRRFAVKSSNDSADDVLDFSLIIHPVIGADAGVYMCLIADQSEEMQRFVHLDVTEAATLWKAEVGTDVALPCNSTFLNPVKWTYHNAVSNNMSVLVQHGRVKTSCDNFTRFSVESVSNLVISDVTMTDAGLYFCTEDDGFGAKHPVMLSVLDDGGVNTSEVPDKVGFLIEVHEKNEESSTTDRTPVFRAVQSPPVKRYWILLIVIGLITVVGLCTIIKVTCTSYLQLPQRSDVRQAYHASSADNQTPLNSPPPSTPSRERLYGVSDQMDVVACSSDSEHHNAAVSLPSDPAITTTYVQAFPPLGVMGPEFPVHPNPTGDLIVAEPQSLATGSRPVAELKSQVIPGPSSDRGELEAEGQALLEAGSVPGDVRCEVAFPASVVVVHATVERQLSDES